MHGRANAVLALAFNELLDAPKPVTVARLAGSLGAEISALEQQLSALAERGWIRRDREGSILGSRGLSIELTRHELSCRRGGGSPGVRDTLGIFGAIAARGKIRSRTPLEQPVELEVVDGRPAAADGVVLFFSQQVTSVIDEWCPLANFFLNREAARAWADANGVEGQVLTGSGSLPQKGGCCPTEIGRQSSEADL